ncbi:MAG: Methionine-tRNA ligase [Candidatus Roizmanbacteria bacterium GW2011_GWA2_35_19]|uniref:Methionine-tRNA ligase n=2 Tax=Candidatus Roizmaniibacteriota TaxID=1752723 RepID=A0A0G0EGV2_9BACT|nr:MAG: Methionine-tRNA ligase [Candidatus Roizmanbacteria bacterium GW2011_GWC2_35_12]KKP74440.1 MAG: Methionine-tRNA ligase [Candidatus Roizmanbacteria bacterium GW2011_GWA2_35_19]
MKKDTIAFPDFSKLDFRVGEVKEASLVEKSKYLIKLKVDLGADYGEVDILSGLAPKYSPEDLIGNKYIFLSNLEAKQMMGMSSNGMVLVAEDDIEFVLVPLDKKIKNGTVIR